MKHVQVSCALAIGALASAASAQGPSVSFHWIDGRGAESASLQAGDTLRVQVAGLVPLHAYDLVLRDDAGNVLGFSRSAAQADGSLGPDVLWWESGVSGTDPAGDGRTVKGFPTFADAERFLLAHKITVEARDSDPADPSNGPLVASATVPVIAPRTTPLLWFSDARRNYRTCFEVGREPIYVSGENLPAGATVDLFVVHDREEYAADDELVDVTGPSGSIHKERVYLGASSTSFTIPVWPEAWQRTGSFDLVARVNDRSTGVHAKFRDDDLLFHGLETGLHVRPQPPQLGPAGLTDLDAQLAGRRTLGQVPPGFRYSNVFTRHEIVRAALDPTDVPADHKAGDWALIYVVRSRTARQWHAIPYIGTDLTETVEARLMKPGTLEMTIGPIWNDPDPLDPKDQDCDVVLDFEDDFKADHVTTGTPGSPPGTGGGGAIFNGLYDVGVDVIDSLDGVGFKILDDPGDPGPYPVGRTDYDFTDAYNIPWGQYKDKNVDVRAVVAYPGQTAGKNVAVYGTNEKFPIIVILHGNHQVCTNFQCTCSSGLRVPNHKGYDYLLDLWASHGFIAVSVDGYDITGCPADRFIERGALIIEHLRYWTNWNDPTVPDATFSGRYWGRIDMNRIGIAGHSRGGEGVAAAVQINQDLALGYHIKSALLIAPTDYNNVAPPGGGPTAFVIADTPVMNIMGSSDGDVVDVEGAQLWDRAAPDGRRSTKAQAFVYGADHNSWNTVWIDPAWGGGSEGVGGGRITAQQQQDTGRVYFTAWWMATLQGRSEMLAFDRGVVTSPKLAGISTFWSYEALDHVNIDNFQDTPVNKALNSLGGANLANPTPVTWKESGLRPGNYDGSFYQDTDGVIIGWNTQTDYEIDIPAGSGDASPYLFLTFRVAQIWDNGVLNPGTNQHFLVDVEDGNGTRSAVDVNSRGFSIIPVGYYSPAVGTRSMLSSVRIPLRSFTQNDSGVDLKNVAKVIVTLESTGLLAIDNIQFSQ